MLGFNKKQAKRAMRKFAPIIVSALLFSCVFAPEDAEEPSGRFSDNLNLRDMVSGTAVSFTFGSFHELFEDSDTLFRDINGNDYRTQLFINRLNTINSINGINCEWTFSCDDGAISISETRRLCARSFTVSAPDRTSAQRTGEVRITVRHTGAAWQIVKWEEMDETWSFFHPVLGGALDN